MREYPAKHRVLQNIGEISGVIGVAIIHDRIAGSSISGSPDGRDRDLAFGAAVALAAGLAFEAAADGAVGGVLGGASE